jgi:phage terminase large subunit GpA-like protein
MLIKPPPKLTVSEWADTHRYLPETSASPGRWNTDRVPFLKGMMDAVNEDGIQRIVIKKSAQVGGTELILNTLGYFIHHDPSPVLMLQPTLQMAQDFSKDRLDPMIQDSPELKKRVSDRKSRDTSNTLLQKKFRGGYVTLAGANSPASLASRPIRIVLADEIDRYPKSAGDEGSPLRLAQKRTTSFWNALYIENSTPTIAGHSAIDESWQDSDQRRFYVPCPFCQHWQTLKFERLRPDFLPDGKPVNPRYECEGCSELIPESHKYAMVKAGEWRASKPFHGTAGFHINELYSTISARGWLGILRDYHESKDNPEKLKTFINTSLGECFEAKEGDSPNWEILHARREQYAFGSCPDSVQFVTAGCDVQKDRLEVECVGWCSDKQSYSLDYFTFFGDTSSIDSECWRELDKLIGKSFQKPDGTQLPIALLAIDSGYNTQAVYNWARNYPPSRVMVTKGMRTQATMLGQGKSVDVTFNGKKIKRGVTLWPLGVDILKAELYGWLKLPKPEAEGEEFRPGYCHFPEYPEEYFKQLTAEVLTAKFIRGHKVYEWEKVRDRNEALDCRVMARACAHRLGLDRLSEEKLERVTSRVTTPVETKTAMATKPETKRPKIKRVQKESWI